MAVSYKGTTCLVNTNSQRNKDVFNAFLKEFTVSLARTSARSWFLALGPATANDRAPKYMTVGLTTRSPRVADHSPCLLPTDATGRRRSARYVGASLWRALNVSRHDLNWTRCWTGSQWRWSHSTCLMWSCFLAQTSNRAAVFKTDCRRSCWYGGAQASKLLR